MAGTPLAGTNGRVKIGNVALTQAKWSVRPKGNLLPSTNFESADPLTGIAYFEGIFGVRECDVTFSGFWDAAANPHTTFGLIGGAVISNVQIFVSRAVSQCFSFSSFLCIDVSVDDDVNGMLMISVTGKANGSFTYPS